MPGDPQKGWEIFRNAMSAQMSTANWISIDFKLDPEDEEYFKKKKEKEDAETVTEFDEFQDYLDNHCQDCFVKLKWINLYLQCPDCRKIYG